LKEFLKYIINKITIILLPLTVFLWILIRQKGN